MITILQFHHAFRHIEGTVPKPTEPTAKIRWEQHGLLAQILIKNNMSDKQMVHVNQANISTAAQMWNSLKAVHKV